MDTNEIISTLVAFVFGLIAKFLYDIWSERRKRKSLLIRKTIITSFSLDSLEKGIREKLNVLYQNHPITSIQLVRVGVENVGLTAIKDQAVTVRFSDGSQIIGEPTSNSSTEDLRYINYDRSSLSNNSRRILFELLRKNSKVSWDFAVINHNLNDFTVEHGVSKIGKDITDNDLDAVSTIANEKIDPDVIGRIKRIFTYLILFQIIILTRDSLSQYFSQMVVPIANLLAATLLIFLIQEISKSITPIMGWLRDTFSPKEQLKLTVGGNVSDSNIIIGDTNSINTLQFDQKILRKFLKILDSENENPQLIEGVGE